MEPSADPGPDEEDEPQVHVGGRSLTLKLYEAEVLLTAARWVLLWQAIALLLVVGTLSGRILQDPEIRFLPGYADAAIAMAASAVLMLSSSAFLRFRSGRGAATLLVWAQLTLIAAVIMSDSVFRSTGDPETFYDFARRVLGLVLPEPMVQGVVLYPWLLQILFILYAIFRPASGGALTPELRPVSLSPLWPRPDAYAESMHRVLACGMALFSSVYSLVLGTGFGVLLYTSRIED